MEKQQAREYVKSILQAPFDLDSFSLFIKNLLNEIVPRDKHYSGNLIPEAFRNHISQYWRLGKYEDPDGEEIDILVIEVKTQEKLERARTAMRNFVVNRLKTFDKDYALTAFYCKEDQQEDWRFSFVKIEHESSMGEDGKIKSQTVLTPAKRSSFLVGVHENSYTAQKQLLPLLEVDYANPSLEEVEDAFSIEKVTDEFFQQYKEVFAKIKEHFSSNDAIFRQEGIDIVRFSKKLLGQIVFIYFLQKKGWMGVEEKQSWGSGNKKFLRKLYEQAEENNLNFYNDYLRLLFYEALAKERESSWYEPLSCRIPFLNGGLFEPEYDWVNSRLKVPNELFHNTEKNKAGDVGTGILDIFDRYNFTIKEDEPLEREVAVDPEMLGKVFENMLEITERKSKGAFYTPREIVHYMCQESLIHYLDKSLNTYHQPVVQGNIKQPSLFGEGKNQHLPFQENTIKVPLGDLQQFVRRGHLFLENEIMALDAEKRIASKKQKSTTHKLQVPEAVRKHAQEVDDYLADIKICDPAIGSGAFPVGLLHEIVTVRLVLQAYLDRKQQQTPYELKLHAIQNSIYGVDIDSSAVDIARLRLWLSLIVDEEFDEIAALPNLDYKIVQGDSLIGFPVRDTSVFGASKVEQEIVGLKEQFFTITDHVRKAKLKGKIDSKIADRMTNSKQVLGYEVNFDYRYLFSEVWLENKGFDVVIGNPPYRQIQKFDNQTKHDWEKQKYKTFAKTGDIYCLFYEKGGQLLRKNGCLAFITSNKWMRAKYGQNMRKYFLDRVNVQQLIDFGESPIFSEATTYTNILIFSKEKSQHPPLAWDLTEAYQASETLEKMLTDNEKGTPVFNPDSFIVVPAQVARIKIRIEEQGTPIEKLNVHINYGIKTGFNDAFIIDGKTRDELISKDPKSAEILKPILRGRDIKRYQASFADLWLIDSHNGFGDVPSIDINYYPAVKDHLELIENKRIAGELGEKAKKAKGLYQRDDQGKTPYNLRNCAYHQEFEKEKIIWLEMSPKPNFTYSANTMFVLNTAYILSGPDLLYLLTILNSATLSFYFPLVSTDVRGKTRRYTKQYVEKLPIPNLDPESKRPFQIMADYLLFLKGKAGKLQTAYFEQLVDGMVYELYFPGELKTAGKQILPYIGTLKPLSSVMSPEEKLAIIQSEFDRLYDPEHPVRNNLETLDSVDEVRTIQEAVQR